MVIGIHNTCWEQTAAINEECNFPASNVVEETLKCQQSNKLVYQGRLVGTRRAGLRTIIDYINKWILFSSDAISIRDDDNTYVLEVDKTCPPYLTSPLDPNCTPELNSITMSTDVLSSMAIVAMIILMIVLTVGHFMNALKHNEISSINHTYNYNYKLNKYEV